MMDLIGLDRGKSGWQAFDRSGVNEYRECKVALMLLCRFSENDDSGFYGSASQGYARALDLARAFGNEPQNVTSPSPIRNVWGKSVFGV